MDQIVKEQKMRALQQLLLQALPYAWCVNNYPKLKAERSPALTRRKQLPCN